MGELKLIGENGRPNFGIYDRPVNNINLQDLRPYGKNRYSGLERKYIYTFKIKKWEYIGLTDSNIVFGSAIVSTGYLGNVFFYLFDRKKKDLYEMSFIKPFARDISFSGGAQEGEVSFNTADTSLKYTNGAESIEVDLRHRDIIKAHLVLKRTPNPLSVIVREALEGFNYTNKEAGLVSEGEIELRGEKFSIDKTVSFGVLDYTVGYLKRETFWNWASGGGFLEDNRRLGFNLSMGINESGITENVLWLGDEPIKLGNVTFNYNDTNVMDMWQIFSTDNKVYLTFTPEGIRKADINAIFIKSKFYQPFGRFSGNITIGERKIALKEVYGFVEEHYAKW